MKLLGLNSPEIFIILVILLSILGTKRLEKSFILFKKLLKFLLSSEENLVKEESIEAELKTEEPKESEVKEEPIEAELKTEEPKESEVKKELLKEKVKSIKSKKSEVKKEILKEKVKSIKSKKSAVKDVIVDIEDNSDN